MIDLRPDFLEIVIGILEKYIPNIEVWAFGSRVAWTAKEFSDLDLAIINNEPLDKKVLLNLEEAFEESDLPIKVDIVEFYKVSKEFQEIIKKNYEVLITKKEDKKTSVEKQLPDGWRVCKLENVIQFGNGKVRPKSIGTIPVYGGNGILEYCNEFNYADETIIIGRVGAYCGSVYYSQNPIWVSDNALAAKPKDYNDAYFLFYFLKNLKLNQFAQGSSHPLVTQSLLNSIDVKIPKDLNEQKEIACILGSLDDKIEINRKLNKTLEEIAQTIFQSWFIDFDPVKAKIEALSEGKSQEQAELAAMCIIASKTEEELIEFQKQNPKEYNDLAETAALFPSEFEESELGLIPKGWGVSPISKLISVRDGTHDSPKKVQDGFPLITSKHLTAEGIDFKSAYLVSSKDFEEINRRSKVHKLDILISMIGTVGTLLLVQEEKPFAIKNIGLFKSSEIPEYARYLYLFLKSIYAEEYFRSRLAGSTQQYLTLESLRTIPILLPSKKALNAFEISISPLIQKLYSSRCEIQALQQLRDSLLPKLISGEIRMKS